jgi:hypothetical protein
MWLERCAVDMKLFSRDGKAASSSGDYEWHRHGSVGLLLVALAFCHANSGGIRGSHWRGDRDPLGVSSE